MKPNSVSLQPAGILLSKYVLGVAFLLLLLAAWAGQNVIVVLLGLGLAAAGLSWLWSLFSLKGVRCERQISDRRLFPGEYLELRLRLVNRKLLPLPWVRVTDEVPEGFLERAGVPEGTRPGFAQLARASSVLWYSAATWKYRLKCLRRGYYPLGPLTVVSGDIFGLYPRSAVQPGNDYFLVYPQLFDLEQTALHSLFPLGEARTSQRLFEDPSRTVGIRDYHPGDGLRRIHWKASLRQGELQVKVFEPSTTLKAAIFLGVDTFQRDGIWRGQDLELAISGAASLAKSLIEKKSQVGLFSNARLADSQRSAFVPVGGGPDQLLQILEHLAKAIPAFDQTFGAYFQDSRQALSLGTTLIFVSERIPPEMAGVLVDLQERGFKITVFQTASEASDPMVAGIDFHCLSGLTEKAKTVAGVEA